MRSNELKVELLMASDTRVHFFNPMLVLTRASTCKTQQALVLVVTLLGDNLDSIF